MYAQAASNYDIKLASQKKSKLGVLAQLFSINSRQSFSRTNNWCKVNYDLIEYDLQKLEVFRQQ